MQTYNFDSHSNRSDWKLPFSLNAKAVVGSGGWAAPDDEILVGLSMSGYDWDDYGFTRCDGAPFWQASSNDGSNVVTLVMPSSIDILVPASAFARVGVGTMDVGVHFQRASTNQSYTLLIGRLPVVNGIV